MPSRYGHLDIFFIRFFIEAKTYVLILKALGKRKSRRSSKVMVDLTIGHSGRRLNFDRKKSQIKKEFSDNT